MGRPLLKRGLSPLDFLDSEARVTEWIDFPYDGMKAYRIWICRSGRFWFQRHEWLREGENQTRFDDWIHSTRSFGGARLPAPEIDED